MYPIGILTGPTGTGKSQLAVQLAAQHPALEIIYADSLAVYRGLDIGSAKPSLADQKQIPHHLIDLRDPHEPFTAGDFFSKTTQTLQDIHARGKRALILGGTGFYLKALIFGMWGAHSAQPAFRDSLKNLPSSLLHQQLAQHDPLAAQRIGPTDTYRLVRALELIHQTGKTPSQLQKAMPLTPHPRFHLWIIDRPDVILHERIAQRTEQMIQQGILEETYQLAQSYPQSSCLHAVGYAQVHRYLLGQLPQGRSIAPGVPGLISEINLAHRQLIKRQRTWFRNFKKNIPQCTTFELDNDLKSFENQFHSLYHDPL